MLASASCAHRARKEAIRSAWTQLLTNPKLKIDWQITKIDVFRAGDMAYILYKYEISTR